MSLIDYRHCARRARCLTRPSPAPARLAAAALGAAACLLALPAHAQRAEVAQAAPLLAAHPVVREEPALRLGDVYAALSQRSPKAAAARALADATAARVPGATLPPDPEVQLGFMNYDPARLRPMDPLGMVQLQVMQMVPTAGKLGLSGRIARAKAAAERERAAEVGWELRGTAAMAFFDVYQAERGAAIARETRRLLEDMARVAESMYRVGEGRQADVLRAQVEIARMAEEIAQMEAMREAAAARLNALLDLPSETPVPSALLPRFPAALPPRDSLERAAAGNRPMIRAGLQDVEAADAMSQLARRERIPDLVVGVQLGQRSADMGMGTERMGSLMLGASVPIYASRRQAKMREEAVAMRDMALADVRYMRAETRGKIGEAYAALVRARNLAALYERTVLPQAEATVASALAAYRVGQVDFMTLLDSRMSVNAYRQQLVTLHAQEGLAWAELEMLTALALMDADSVAPAARGGNR